MSTPPRMLEWRSETLRFVDRNCAGDGGDGAEKVRQVTAQQGNWGGGGSSRRANAPGFVVKL
jgi:hypothetical protein